MKQNVLRVIFVAGVFMSFAGCEEADDVLGNPIISDISPESGSENGGTIITITGENLDDNATIEIGGVDCSFEVFTSNNEITCLTGEKSVSEDTTYDVVVTNPDGESDTLEDAFTYEDEDEGE